MGQPTLDSRPRWLRAAIGWVESHPVIGRSVLNGLGALALVTGGAVFGPLERGDILSVVAYWAAATPVPRWAVLVVGCLSVPSLAILLRPVADRLRRPTRPTADPKDVIQKFRVHDVEGLRWRFHWASVGPIEPRVGDVTAYCPQCDSELEGLAEPGSARNRTTALHHYSCECGHKVRAVAHERVTKSIEREARRRAGADEPRPR